jgi:hypothetical protein
LRPALASALVILLAGGVILLILASRGSGMVRPAKVVEQSMLWSVDAHSQDWPGPVRAEPMGVTSRPIIVEADPTLESIYAEPDGKVYRDTVGDVGFDAVDVVEVVARDGCWNTLTTEHCVFFDLSSTVGGIPDPLKLWIAYGIVVDYTGDGFPDARYGIDNALGNDRPGLRMWRADLSTGAIEAPVCCEDPRLMDAVFPFPGEFPPGETRPGSIFVVREESEGVFRFYVWASVIEDGRVVSTDYAPDSGWIAIAP